MRLVTWNVHSCVGPDRRVAPERIAAVLAPLDADVIGLQEVDWRHPPIDGLHQLDFLARRLDRFAVSGPTLSDPRGTYGNGLLVRRAPEAVRALDLAVDRRREPRGAIDVDLCVDGTPLRVLVTHLGLRGGERRRQLDRLRAVVGDGDAHGRTALLADLNHWLPGRLARPPLEPDPFPVSLGGRTFPSRAPVFALDRILLRPVPWRLEWRVLDTPAARRASDHLPVVCDVEWRHESG